MAFVTKNLGQGQLPSSIGDLYTVPGATTAIIKSISYVNTDSVTRTANLYVLKSGTTARRIIPLALSMSTGDTMLLDDVLTLGAGDKIQGDASAATVVDYIISGVEEA